MTIVKRITQESFDETVQENIDTFEMEPEEAVQEAIKEFQMQGVDLAGIIKNYAGEGGRGDHPVLASVRAFESALEIPADEAFTTALEDLNKQLGPEGQEGAAELAGRNGATETLIAACKLESHRLLALQTLQLFLGHEQSREFFYARKGVPMLFDILKGCTSDAVMVGAVAQAIAEAATKHEGNKVASMLEVENGAPLVSALEEHQHTRETVQSICDILKALTTGDDPREAASGAFRNAQTLAKLGAATSLLKVLESMTDVDTDEGAAKLAGRLCFTLKLVAANEEVCKQVTEHNGVGTIMRMLQGPAVGKPALARPACALLRQLAGSDTVKPGIIQAGGLPAMIQIMQIHMENQETAVKGPEVSTVEQAIGLLTAVCLRNPSGATAMAEAGCLEAVIATMRGMPCAPSVQRQACMCLRNAVVRNPENKPRILQSGAEALILAAKRDHSSLCIDVGSAALRDLGCENYNKGWKPTTVIMGADGVMRTPEELEQLSDEQNMELMHNT
eukprot:1196374-Prorocentrum_minimum.AAC.2